jgi:hypothetical protein
LEVRGSLKTRRRAFSNDNSPSGPRQKRIPEEPIQEPTLLEINVRAHGSAGLMNPTLADLQTTITAPEGHSVVLGVSPVGALTSVFVVQLRR